MATDLSGQREPPFHENCRRWCRSRPRGGIGGCEIADLAAAVAVAALRRGAESLRGMRVALVICSGNVSPAQLRSVL